MALIILVAIAQAGKNAGPVSEKENGGWEMSEGERLLARTRQLNKAGLLENGDTVHLQLKTAKLRTHGARTTMLEDYESYSDYPKDLEQQSMEGTRYCYDTVTDCRGQIMWTAKGADYSRPPPPPPPPVDVAAIQAAASVVEDTSDPDAPGPVDEAQAESAANAYEGGCDGLDDEEWIECEAEVNRAPGAVDWG